MWSNASECNIENVKFQNFYYIDLDWKIYSWTNEDVVMENHW